MKDGIYTTEFWSAILTTVGLFTLIGICLVKGIAIPSEIWSLAIPSAAYSVGRGITKAGGV